MWATASPFSDVSWIMFFRNSDTSVVTSVPPERICHHDRVDCVALRLPFAGNVKPLVRSRYSFEF